MAQLLGPFFSSAVPSALLDELPQQFLAHILPITMKRAIYHIMLGYGIGAEITEGNVMTASSGNNLLAQLSGTAEAKMSCCKIAPAV